MESVDAPAERGDTWRLHVRPASEEGRVRQAVLVAAVEQGLRLTAIRPIVPSLDDIYRTAVEKRPTGAEAAGRDETRGSGAVDPGRCRIAGADPPDGRPSEQRKAESLGIRWRDRVGYGRRLAGCHRKRRRPRHEPPGGHDRNHPSDRADAERTDAAGPES